MAKAKRLTAAAVERLRAAKPDKRDEHFDSVVPGLSLRVTDKGRKTWSYLFRMQGSRSV